MPYVIADFPDFAGELCQDKVFSDFVKDFCRKACFFRNGVLLYRLYLLTLEGAGDSPAPYFMVKGVSMYTDKVEAYLSSILPDMGYGLDSTEFVREDGVNYLRAYIYRLDQQDMTVNDCALVSRRLSKWLDREDFIQEEYTLEVCSMGFKEPANETPDPDYKETNEETEEEENEQ